MSPRLPLLLLALSLLLPPSVTAADWLHWRGPEQTGVSREPGLPDDFDLSKVGENNLLWKADFGGRSAPLVMNGKLYVINGFDPSKATEGERVVCFDADTGKKEWETRFSVFHTDIVTSRLGWTTLAADPKEKTVFAHTTAGHLLALDAADGKIRWQRQLTEEFGRVTGYGGRISSPLFDPGSGLVVVGLVNGSWGDQARGGSRFAAFDGKTGEVVWWQEVSTPSRPLRGTYYSNPVVAVINGQRLVISGGADGALHAMKIRTGELVWSYHFSAGVINPSPVVDGNLVYCAHGEPNPGGGVEGRVICVDGSKVENKQPKLVWEYKDGKRFGLASPALHDGKLYMPDDGGALFCFDAADGKVLWEVKYGNTARGSPLIAGGKLYVFDVNARLAVINLQGGKKPDPDEDLTVYPFRFADPKKRGFPETNGTPIAVNGKLYFQTAEALYCVGAKDAKPTEAKYTPLPEETPFDPKAKPAGVMVFPAEASAKPGGSVKFAVRYVDANGRELAAPADAKPEWSLPLPPKTPAGAQPPALAGEVKDGTLTVAAQPPAQQGYVEVRAGGLTGRGRVRVIPQLPVKQDFEKVPVGSTPAGWLNTQGKYSVVEFGPDKLKVLSKVNTDSRPPIARANAYITAPNSSDYTIQADVYAGEVGGKLPDMGVVANRSTLVLEGKTDTDDTGKEKRYLRVISWEARNRIDTGVEFTWKKDTWYTLKYTVEVKDGKGVLKGKVWERGQPEPKDWTITVNDPYPNAEGAAALYGYVSNVTGVPGSPIYYDNVSVTPNK